MKIFDFKLLLKLLSYVKRYKYVFVTTIIVSVCFGVLSTIRPLLIQYAFDNYILKYDVFGLSTIVLLIAPCLLAEGFFQFIFIYRSNYLGQNIINDIRTNLFSKKVSLKVNYFDKTPTGQLITRVISDMEAISSVFSQGLLVVFGDLFKMLLIIICMFLVNWKLTLISLAFLPFLIITTIIFQKYMQRAFLDVRKYISKINVFVYEHIIGMSIIQIFGQEQEELKSFKVINALHRDANIKTVVYFSIFLPIVDIFSAIAMGLLVWYGAIQAVSNSSITMGEIIAFILFINMLFRPLRSIADRFNVLQMGIVSASRVFYLMEQNIDQENYNDFSTADKLSVGSIVFKNVNFAYKKEEPVLKNVNFKVNPNETLAIIGATG